MKILFLSTQQMVSWGGSEVLWHDAAHVLLAGGHEVHVAYLDHGDRMPAPLRSLLDAGAVYHPLGWLNPPRLIDKALRRVPGDPFAITVRRQLEKLARLRPALAVITTGSSSVWPECRDVFVSAGVPYALVIQAANDRTWYADDFREKLVASYREAREVFYVSEGNRRLVNGQLALPDDFGRVVFNPFTVPFEPQLPWPAGDTPRLAFVGRLDPEPKGCDLILETLALPRWRERDLQMDFFGSGPCEKGLREVAAFRGLPGVAFAGHAASVLDVWKTHHALVLPSRFEGMPLAMIEAMLCGRVCIVTDIPGNAELIEEGVTGFIAESPTVRHLDAAMERAWNARADWPEIGRRAAEVARTRVPAEPGRVFAEILATLYR